MALVFQGWLQPDHLAASAEPSRFRCLDFGEVPLLVIEVASGNWREDYSRKRAEYALIDIPEYCIVTPQQERVKIMVNPANEDGYKHVDFMRGEQTQFPQFPDLILSVDQVLSPASVEDSIKIEHSYQQELLQRLEEDHHGLTKNTSNWKD